MGKGISPVVATTLLVAIAVLSSVAIWYWASSYTTQPPITQTTQKGYVVTGIYTNSSNTGCVAVDIRNAGGAVISSILFEVRDYSTGRPAGANGTNPAVNAYVNISIPLNPGATSLYNLSSIGNASNRTSVLFGTYYLRPSTLSPTSIAGLADQIFTCTG